MKKTTILYVLVLMLSFGLSAQQFMSNEQYAQLSPQQKALYNRIKANDSVKIASVNSYLSQNPLAKRSYKDNKGGIHVLTDIIDNVPVYTVLDNSVSAAASGTNALQVGGSSGLNLDGAGVSVAIWDGGPVQTSHPELQDASGTASRVTNIDFSSVGGELNDDFHGMHVTGTIVAKGVNASAKGMATNATLRTYNFLNDTPEMVVEATSPANPLIVSNHSYGIPVQTGLPWFQGAYTSDARDIDDIARSNPKYLMVMSAGNSGNTTYDGGLFAGFDQLTGDKTAKNNLVVANADANLDLLSGELSGFPISSSSSKGPTDDLRIKPDISGNGTQVFSAFPDDAYGVLSGTSMAAPHLAGSAVLLQQYYNQLNGDFANSATIKALICHTAIDDPTFPGPDPTYGWGFLNAEKAAAVLTDDANGTAVVEELTLSNGGTYTLTFNADGQDALSATICWTDLPGGAVSGEAAQNSPVPRLVNDLDIRITKDGTTYLPWKLNYDVSSGFSTVQGDNLVDNIERIDIDTPTAGSYTLTVTHKGQLAGDDPFLPGDQNFSLVLTGSAVSLGTNESVFNNFAIWPNPANTVLNVNFESLGSEDVKMTLLNIDGRKVLEKTISPATTLISEQLNVSSLNSGLYILSLTQGNRTENRKVIIN